VHDIGLQLFEESLELNNQDIDKALSETIQSTTLLGLSRTDFFAKAAFYGGTALTYSAPALFAGKLDAVLLAEHVLKGVGGSPVYFFDNAR
jgi:hypothetical protein